MTCGGPAALYHRHVRLAEPRVDLEIGEAAPKQASATLARKWSSRPPAPPTTVIRCAPRSRATIERELEVGRVLVDGMPFDDRARGPGAIDGRGFGGVEITDDVVDVEIRAARPDAVRSRPR